MDLRREIDRTTLENPRFDLIKWYLIHLEETGIFWNKYRQLHELFYNPLPEGEEDEYADLPGLVSWDDDDATIPEHPVEQLENTDKVILDLIATTLEECKPYPNDREVPMDSSYRSGSVRFIVEPAREDLVCVYDRVQGFEAYLYWKLARSDSFSVGKWFAEQCALNAKERLPEEISQEWMSNCEWTQTTIKLTKKKPETQSSNNSGPDAGDDDNDGDNDPNGPNGCGYCTSYHPAVRCSDDGASLIPVSGIQVSKDKYPTLQRNSAKIKDGERLLPKPVVIKVTVNGEPARALIDSGSLGDFMSSTLVDQLKLKRNILEKAVGLQLAVQGSRSKINA